MKRPPKRKNRPSDGVAIFKAVPKPGQQAEDADDIPVPIIFSQSTFVKLILWTLGPLIVFISTAIYFYHRTNLHMDDKNIHLKESERRILQTKDEAQYELKKAKDDIKEHVDIKVREIKVEQKEQLEEAKKELKRQQSYHYNKIISEIRERK